MLVTKQLAVANVKLVLSDVYLRTYDSQCAQITECPVRAFTFIYAFHQLLREKNCNRVTDV